MTKYNRSEAKHLAKNIALSINEKFDRLNSHIELKFDWEGVIKVKDGFRTHTFKKEELEDEDEDIST